MYIIASSGLQRICFHHHYHRCCYDVCSEISPARRRVRMRSLYKRDECGAGTSCQGVTIRRAKTASNGRIRGSNGGRRGIIDSKEESWRDDLSCIRSLVFAEKCVFFPSVYIYI